MRQRLYYGVDGCSGGWLVTCLTKGPSLVSFSLIRSTSEMLEQTAQSTVTLIDIPIGLKEDASRRSCDVQARAYLGKRGSSVFPVPVRQALHSGTYEDASRRNFQIAGRRLSRQSWFLARRIAEVDEVFVRYPRLQLRIRESHPEVCFRSLAGSELSSKHTRRGFLARVRVLRTNLAVARELFLKIRKAYPRHAASDHDILDSLVCALVAVKGQKEGFKVFPVEGPEKDPKRLLMEIVFA